MTYKLVLFLCLTISMECRKLGSDHTNKEVVSWGLGRCDEEVPENHPQRSGCLEGVVSGERVTRASHAATLGNPTFGVPPEQGMVVCWGRYVPGGFMCKPSFAENSEPV